MARLEDMAVMESHELLLLSVVTAVYKLVETLAQFLVPYLSSILKQVRINSVIYSLNKITIDSDRQEYLFDVLLL